MVVFTMDTDWAPLTVVEEALELFSTAGCKITLFCTNEYPIKADELAIHPNFTNLNNLWKPIWELKKIYPFAKGIRSHCLFFTERFRPLYAQFRLTYDSNAIQYLKPSISCSQIGVNTISIPIFFMDRFFLEMVEQGIGKFNTDWIDWEDTGLKVFDFHPIHIVLNTPSVAHYERAKVDYHDPKELKKWVHFGPGIRSFLIEILGEIQRRNIKTYTMTEIEEHFRYKIFPDSSEKIDIE